MKLNKLYRLYQYKKFHLIVRVKASQFWVDFQSLPYSIFKVSHAQIRLGQGWGRAKNWSIKTISGEKRYKAGQDLFKDYDTKNIVTYFKDVKLHWHTRSYYYIVYTLEFHPHKYFVQAQAFQDICLNFELFSVFMSIITRCKLTPFKLYCLSYLADKYFYCIIIFYLEINPF